MSATISSMPIPIISRAATWSGSAALPIACTPTESVGRRISDVKLDNGRSLEAGKSYKVAGWASVNEQQGKPVWDVFAKHLALREDAGSARHRRHAEGCRRQSRDIRTGMRNFAGISTLHPARIRRRRDGGGDDRSDVPGPRPAGAAAGQALRRAPHRAAAFGQRPEKTRPRDQRRLQSAQGLRSRQGRDRGGDLRSGHRSAAHRTMPTANSSRAWSRRACASTFASTPSTPSSAKPASGRTSSPPRPRFRSVSGRSWH